MFFLDDSRSPENGIPSRIRIVSQLLVAFGLIVFQGCSSKQPTPPAPPTPPPQANAPAAAQPQNPSPKQDGGNNNATVQPALNPQEKSATAKAETKSNAVETKIVRSDFCVDFSLDGRTAVSGGKNATIRLFDIEKGSLLRTFTGQKDPVTAISMQKDGSMIAAGGSEGRVLTWDARSIDGLDESERDLLGSGERMPFSGHTGAIRSLAFRPDGKEIASGGDDGTIRYWRLPGSYPESIWTSNNSVISIAAIPHSNFLIAAISDGSVELWELNEKQTIPLLKKNDRTVTALAADDEGAFVAAGDDSGTVRVADVKSRAVIFEQAAHQGAVTGIRFRPKRPQIVTIGADGVSRSFDLQAPSGAATSTGQAGLHSFQSKGRLLSISPGGGFAAVAGGNTVEVADLKNRTLLPPLAIDGKEVSSLAWAADDRTLVAGDASGGLHVWLIPGGQKLFDSRIHDGAIHAVAASSKMATVVSGGTDSKLRVWSQPGLPEMTVDLKSKSASHVAASPDGKMVAVATKDGTLSIVDVEKKRVVTTLTAVGKSPNALAWDQTSEWLAVGGNDGVVRVWNSVQGLDSVATIEAGASITRIAFHPSGPTLIAGLQNGYFKTWTLPLQDSRSLSGHTDTITSIVGSRLGSLVVTGGNDRVCRLFDVDRSEQVRVFNGAQNGITSVAQSSDDRWIAAGDRGGQISIWNTNNTELTGSVQTFDVAINRIAIDPSNRHVASASIDGSVRVWRRDLALPVSIKSAAQDSEVLALSPDAKRIALSQADRSIVIRDTRSGDQLQLLTGHKNAITAIGWSTDGTFVVSSSLDETVSLWKVADGQRIVTWEGHSNPVRAVAISTNNEELRACSSDGRLLAYKRATNQQRVLADAQKDLAIIAVSPSGNRLAFATANGTVTLLNFETGESLGKTKAIEKLAAIAWCGDDQHWVSVDSNRSVKYWKLSNVDSSRSWSNSPKGLTRFCVSSDGSRFMALTAEGRPQLWNSEGNVIETLAWDPKVKIQSFVLSGDGRTAAVSGVDGTTTMFQSTLVNAIKAHSGSADLVSFVDDQFLISTGADQSINAWDYVKGTRTRQFEGCPARVVEMAVSKAAGRLIVLGDNNKLYAWNLANGSQVDLPSSIQNGTYRQIGLNVDGQRIAALDNKARLRTFQLPAMTELNDIASPVSELSPISFLKNGSIVCGSDTIALVARGGAVATGYKAHDGATVGVAALPKRDEILTAGEDGKIKVWSLSGNLVRTVVESDSAFRSLAMSEDGSELTALGADNKFRSWNSSGEVINNWSAASRTTSVHYTSQVPRTILSASDTQIRLYQTTKGKLALTLTLPEKLLAATVSSDRKSAFAINGEGSLVRYSIEPLTVDSEQRDIQSLAISRNGDSLVSGSEDSSVSVWSLPNLNPVCHLKGHTKPVEGVTFIGKDSTLFASISSDKTAKIWNVTESKMVRSIPLPSVPLGLSASPDGKNLAVATKEKQLSIFDVQSGKLSQTAGVDTSPIIGVQYNSKGNLTTLNADRRLNTPETKTREQTQKAVAGGLPSLTGLDVFRDGSFYATTSLAEGIKLFDYNGKEIASFESSQQIAKSISVSQNGQFLASYNAEGQTPSDVVIWNVAGRNIASTISTPSPVRWAQFEPESTNLTVLGDDRTLRRYDSSSGKLMESTSVVESIRTDPVFLNSEELLTLDSDDLIRVYRPSLVRMEQAHSGAVSSLTYNNDGSFLISGGVDGHIAAWGSGLGKPVLEFDVPNAAVTDLHIVPAHGTLVATYTDNSVRVWSLKRRSPDPEAIFVHKAPVQCARTSMDGFLMITGGVDKIVHLWMVSAGRELVQFLGHESTVNRLAISPDNKSVVSFGDEDSIRLWKIPDDVLTLRSTGQVDKSIANFGIVREEDAEIAKILASANSNSSDQQRLDQQRLDQLRSGKTPSLIQEPPQVNNSQAIDRDIRNVQRKMRVSTGSSKDKFRKELTKLYLKKKYANDGGANDTSKKEQLSNALKKVDLGDYVSVNEELRKAPGLSESKECFQTYFLFDEKDFYPVKVAIGAELIAVGRPQLHIRLLGTKPVSGTIQFYEKKNLLPASQPLEVSISKLTSMFFNGNILLTAPDIVGIPTETQVPHSLANSSLLASFPSKNTTDDIPSNSLLAIGITSPVFEAKPIIRFLDREDISAKKADVYKNIMGYNSRVTAMAFNPKDNTLLYSERRNRDHFFCEIDPIDQSKIATLEQLQHTETLDKLGNDGLGIELILMASDAKFMITYGKYTEKKYLLKVWNRSAAKGDGEQGKLDHKWDVKNEFVFEMPILRDNDPSRIWLIEEKKLICFEDSNGGVTILDAYADKNNLRKGTASKQLKRTKWGFPVTAHSESGGLFAVGDDAGRLEVWDLKSNDLKTIQNINAHLGPVVGIAISEIPIKSSAEEKQEKPSRQAKGSASYTIVSVGEENLIRSWDQDSNKKKPGTSKSSEKTKK